MRKFASCFSVLILALYSGLVSAQDAYGTITHRYKLPARELPPAPPQESRQLRWRPLEEASGEGSGKRPARQTGEGYPGVSDYTDEPFGLPRGTYRRIEERHTITPHLEGYRFRAIDPDEQLRNRSRNQTQEQYSRGQPFYRSARQNGDIEADRLRGQPPALNFRPDPRLDKDLRGAPPRYAYPMGSEAPIYRPQP